MRRTIALAFLSLGGFGLVWACSSTPSSNQQQPGTDASSDATGDDAGGDVGTIPPQDSGSTVSCTLKDGSDPVALCTEKQVLQYELQGAYAKGKGVAPSWDAITGTPGTPHAWQDDVGFASSIASYHCSSEYYGDTELTPTLDGVLPDLAQTIVAELPQAPDGYDGETYFRLRNAAAGLYYINDNTDAQAIAALADAFGRNLQAKYAQTVNWTTAGGGSDAGAGEGGAPDAGGGGPMMTSTVIGTTVGSNVVYAPAQSIMAAAALLHMATLHAADADAGADAATWAATAFSTLDYVWARGRDATTGLFYQQLITSAPDHDTPYQGTPTPDALLTDVQASAILGLARAQDLTSALPSFADSGVDASAPGGTPYVNEAGALGDALNAAGLWNGPTVSGGVDAGPIPPGAYMEGLIPSSGVKMTNVTTLSAAFLMGGLHRVVAAVGWDHVAQIGQMHNALLEVQPAHSSLYSVVTDNGGFPIQTDYLRAASQDWGYAITFLPDGGDGGQEPGATSYRADAAAAMVEGFQQRWHGRLNAPPCGN